MSKVKSTNKRSLTVKQTKFVKEYVKNDGNGTQAALNTYEVSSVASARALASENLSKLNVKDAIEQALVKHQITMDAAIKPIADGLRADKFVAGEDEDDILMPDHNVRLKASGMALKLLGADKSEDKGGNTFNFIKTANFNAGDFKK